MKTILSKTRDFFTRPRNKTTEISEPIEDTPPYVLFKVLPNVSVGEEANILTGGQIRQSLYKTKSLKSLATALEYVEEAGILFLKDTLPQNIFLIFGDHPEDLYEALLSLPIAAERFKNPRISAFPEDIPSPHKKDLEYKAVIFCKLKGTPKILEFFGFSTRTQEITKWIYSLNWLDFYNLKEKQENPVPHASSE